jgi:hypothetical protein
MREDEMRGYNNRISTFTRLSRDARKNDEFLEVPERKKWFS